MKPTPISNCTFLTSMLLLLIQISLVAPQKEHQCNVKCTSDSVETKVEHPATNLYALKTSENHYSTWKATSLSVKVYRTILPKLDSPGPSWYKIDAFVKETKEAIGKFKNFFTVGQAQEQEISRNGDAAVEFSTWHGFALYDLPRTFNWSKKAGNDGTLCFRLTVLVDRCRETVHCIEPRSVSTMSSPPATESLTNSSSVSEPESADGSGSGSGAMYTPLLNPEDEHKVLPLPLKCLKLNCTNAKQGEFCSLPYDGNKYSSRCEWRREQKCALRARGVDVETMEILKCDDKKLEIYEINERKLCWEDKKEDAQWTRGCKCNGRYKSIQCGNRNKTNCWCSNPYGSQLTNKFDFDPTEDSATYDPYSPCSPLYR